jgi:hypothetical protein
MIPKVNLLRSMMTGANNKDQDIEWVYMRGQIYIVQSRPYLAGGPGMLVNPGQSGN